MVSRRHRLLWGKKRGALRSGTWEDQVQLSHVGAAWSPWASFVKRKKQLTFPLPSRWSCELNWEIHVKKLCYAQLILGDSLSSLSLSLNPFSLPPSLSLPLVFHLQHPLMTHDVVTSDLCLSDLMVSYLSSSYLTHQWHLIGCSLPPWTPFSLAFGHPLAWFSSYLTGYSFSVSLWIPPHLLDP